MLWILLLAQAGVPGSQAIAADGFAFTQDEATQCSFFLWSYRQMEDSWRSSSADLSYRRNQFESCVRRTRAAKISAAKQVDEIRRRSAAEAAAEKEEQRKRQQSLDHEAWIDAEADKVATDPTSRRLVVSALLCDQLSTREALLAKLAKDKKYAKIGGAVDLGRRSEIQDDLAAADDEIRRLRSLLKADKTTALGCSEKRVAMAIACMSDARPPECPEDAANVLVLAARKLSDE